MTENSFDKTTCYSDKEFRDKLLLLSDSPRDEQKKTRPYLRDEKGERLPSVLEKMARNVMKDPGTYDPLNYDASDLAQLTARLCLKRREKFDPSHKDANFPGWVKTVMIRAWQEKLRLKWRRIEVKIPPIENDDDKEGAEEGTGFIDNSEGFLVPFPQELVQEVFLVVEEGSSLEEGCLEENYFQ